jgi:SlyX protein
MRERITDLELRFMHQENTIQELNDTVYRQEQSIMRIERELSLLREQMSIMSPSAIGDAEEEPPPHY